LETVVLMLVLFFALIIIGVPIVFSFGITSILYLLLESPSNLIILISRSFGSVDSFALMAIPFFVLAGDVMKEGEISRNLIRFVDLLVGKIKGGLTHVTVVACTFFGAISGSSAATVAAIGGIMIPEMIKRGYDKRFAVAVAAASGFIGILIPPSVPMIVYGINAQVSVAQLFLAGIGPGVLMTVAFMLINFMMHKRYKNGESLPAEFALDTMAAPGSAWRAIPALIMPLIILGGIYSGLFTPTESGAVAVVYGILVSMLVYRSMSVRMLYKIMGQSAVTSAVILIIVGLAGVFGWLITTERVPDMVATFITGITTNPILILLFINIFYLILGTFMETIAAIVITTPIILPLIKMIGMDPVHFGAVLVTNLCVGLITPPMALNLLIASRIGKVSVLSVVKPLTPYLIASVIVLFLVTFIPEISLFLPKLLLNR